MLSPFNLLLITAVFCVVMLFVLCSLLRSGIPGVKEWTLANGLAFLALLLYAARGVAPEFLSIEAANGLLAASVSAIFVGFRRFFGCGTPARTLAAGLACTVAAVAIFHYRFDSIALRTVTVSIFHATICFAIGATIFRSVRLSRSRYPYRFTACVAILFGLGHCFRGAVYATRADVLTSTLQASGWNLLFLSIGTLVLPVFTMGAVMMVHDRMMAKALDDANRDFLTGAWSRRAFFEFAEREFLRVQRTQRALTLLVFDVDHFKRINDRFGHAAGDRVLVEIVQRAGQEIRSVDYLARIGGEEFAVLLPEVDQSAGSAVAERLRTVLETNPAGENANGDPQGGAAYSVSIGVATLGKTESIFELLARADAALYQAKAAGRNTVVCAPDAMPMAERQPKANTPPEGGVFG